MGPHYVCQRWAFEVRGTIFTQAQQFQSIRPIKVGPSGSILSSSIIKNASHIESCALNHFPLSTEGDLWCSLLPSWRNFNALFFHCNKYLEEISGIRVYYTLPFQSRYTTAHFFLISFDFLIVCALPLILLKIDFIYMLQLMWLALLSCNNLCWIMIEREK